MSPGNRETQLVGCKIGHLDIQPLRSRKEQVKSAIAMRQKYAKHESKALLAGVDITFTPITGVERNRSIFWYKTGLAVDHGPIKQEIPIPS